MPGILKWENRPKTVVQSAFLYLDVAGLLLFQIHISCSGLDLITHPTWMICKCVEAWCKRRNNLRCIFIIHGCNSLQYAICSLFACTFGLTKGRWEYLQATWFVKMIYPETVMWASIFLFSLLWCCKVVPFEQWHTRVYDRPTRIAEVMSTTCRGSKIDLFAVLRFLCSIEWSRLCIQQINYAKKSLEKVCLDIDFIYLWSKLLHKKDT